MTDNSLLMNVFSTSSLISGLLILGASPALSTNISIGATDLGTITSEVIETGTLVSGELASFSFSLDDAANLQITSNGSDFDTELGLYDSSGNLIIENDDGGEGLQSLITTNLDMGTYYTALGGFATTFEDSFEVTPGDENGDFQLAFTPFEIVEPASIDLGLIADGQSTTGSLEFAEVAWFSFSLEDPFTFLDITTNGSDFDTEIGLYNSSGDLIATNDDISIGNLQSTLSFGTGGDFGSGEDGALDAGTFFLALGEFDTAFADLFFVTGGGEETETETETGGGNFQITFATGVRASVPESSTTFSLLVLGSILMGTRLRKK